MGILGKFLALSVKDSTSEIQQSFSVADCAGCDNCGVTADSLPASERYPGSLSVDTDTPLWGSIKPWSLQVLCATGKTDWQHDIFGEKHSLAQAVDASSSDWSEALVDPATGKRTTSRLFISNSSINPPDEYFEFDDAEADPRDRPSRLLILPEFVYIEQVTPRTARDDLKTVINALGKARVAAHAAATNTTTATTPVAIDEKAHSRPVQYPPLAKDTLKSISLASGHKVIAARDLACVVLCSHRTRDKRCAITANILKKKFELELREHDLYRDASDDRPGGVPIHFVSHVGGHKFAANVIVYTKSGQAIWLARVRPEHVNKIIEHTILKGQVFPDLLRSAFNTNPIAW